MKTLDLQKMVRGKIQMKKIENDSSRQVTFSKRRRGLLKKAYELSVLCDAEVAVILFSQKGRLFEFSSSDSQKTIERYRKYAGNRQSEMADKLSFEQRKHEIAAIVRQIEQIEDSTRKLMGHGLETCSSEELQKIEKELERSLSSIRKRRAQLYMEHIEQLKAKCGREGIEARAGNKKAETYCSQSSQSSHAEETQLFIGFRCL